MNLEIPTPAADLTFTQRFSATPRGARLARRLTVQQLADWGIPHATPASDTAALVVAELATNAVTHGRVPGRDFELHLTLTTTHLTVDLSDPRPERLPHPLPKHPLAEEGRGLVLVSALSKEWGVRERRGGVTKTVWAVLALPSTEADNRE
ncbi:ATP-binding protein [Streptomyces sp. NPDC050418]|uniref:ATP-binding protein n=1 Tax=Streptomyces sp. NPDC050418 TaxID=3365612 RepID=UPI00379B6C9D